MKKDAKILILGGNGMLGSALSKKLHSHKNLLVTDIVDDNSSIEYLDVRDLSKLKAKFEEFRPNYVFNLAALVDLEYCQENPKHADDTNFQATKSIAKLCSEYDAVMIYISTAGIFDGKKEFYSDCDTPNPISQYGLSKFKGEEYVLNNLEKKFIFRAGWMMGGGPVKDKKFVNKIIKQIVSGKKELNVVDDKFGSPTYTEFFASHMLMVIASDKYGLYNMVSEGSCNRFDVAKEMLSILKVSDKVILNKVNSAFWEDEYFAERPRSEQLINENLKSNGFKPMNHWKESLEAYLLSPYWDELRLSIKKLY
tara:strand:- start:3111 stop:4040 length:930 start_codon:yes stop_codon:yes gene_type:complete